jgi:hypothetical protein
LFFLFFSIALNNLVVYIYFVKIKEINMQSITSRSYLINIAGRLQVKETIVLLAFSVLIPLLIHFLPGINGQPAGAYLLPIFYAPLIAVLFFRLHTAIITAVLSPVINYLVTGSPHIPLVQVIVLQLALFVTILYFINKLENLRLSGALISYALAMLVLFTVLSAVPALVPGKNAFSFMIDSVTTGIPGLIIIAAVNFAIVKFSQKNN